jgi:uncharacterized protein (DUF2062 family)
LVVFTFAFFSDKTVIHRHMQRSSVMQAYFRSAGLKKKVREWADSLRRLPGDPRYIARGTAVGIFVSLTPTFPFHTAIAVPLAMVLRGSKRAAAIGVWFSNPLTLPLCYIAEYQVGTFLLGATSAFEGTYQDFCDIMQLGIDVTIRLFAGGLVLGGFGAVVAYILTKRVLTGSSFFRRHMGPETNGGTGRTPPPAESLRPPSAL